MSAKMGICSVCEEQKRLSPSGMIYLHKATFQIKDCKGSRKPERAYFEKRDFDALVESQPPEIAEVATLWDGVKALWGPLHGEEGYLVKGMILVECIDVNGCPSFMWIASPGMTDWQIKGLLTQAKDDLDTDSLLDNMFQALASAQQAVDDEDENDIEDEQ